MPYIKKSDRHKICNDKIFIDMDVINTAGEIQYAIAEILKNYMNRKGLNYQNCNDVMGALAGAQMEFYRRTVAPYEDKKIKENGDV